MDGEIAALTRLRDHPDTPYVAVLGGAKVSDKIDLMLKLIDKVEAILIGGAMAYTFMKARGVPIGSSRAEAERIDHAEAILTRAMNSGVRLRLPLDHIAARSPEPGQEARVTPGPAIENGLVGLDIGPKTRDAYAREIAGARTIFWNGPLLGLDGGTLLKVVAWYDNERGYVHRLADLLHHMQRREPSGGRST